MTSWKILSHRKKLYTFASEMEKRVILKEWAKDIMESFLKTLENWICPIGKYFEVPLQSTLAALGPKSNPSLKKPLKRRPKTGALVFFVIKASLKFYLILRFSRKRS